MTPSFEKWRKRATSLPLLGVSVLIGIMAGCSLPDLSKTLFVVPEIFASLMMMLALPLMVSAVIFSLSELIQSQSRANVLGKVLIFFISTKVLFALIAVLVVCVSEPGRDLSAEALTGMGKLLQTDLNAIQVMEIDRYGAFVETAPLTIREVINAIIPANIFAAMSQGEFLKVLFFSILFGLVLGKLPAEYSRPVTSALQGVFNACLKLTIWFTFLLPLVLLGTVANLFATSGLAMIHSMARYLLTMGIILAVIIGMMLVFMKYCTQESWRAVLQSLREAAVMGIVSGSSLPCIALMIDGITTHLKLQRDKVELLAPMGVVLLPNWALIRYTVIPVFLAQLFGKELLLADMAFLVLWAIVFSTAAEGMSNLASLTLTGTICACLGLPFAAIMVLFLAVEPLENFAAPLMKIAVTGGLVAFGSMQNERNKIFI